MEVVEEEKGEEEEEEGLKVVAVWALMLSRVLRKKSCKACLRLRKDL